MGEMIRFIGDVHDNHDRYRQIITGGPRSIQVGDLEVGFESRPDGEPLTAPPYEAMVRGGHRFIRGNHDNPSVCRLQSQWIRDGAFEDPMMFIGGAFSIDREFRFEGYDWWPDEELSAKDLRQMVELYIARRPRIMVTHDCPAEVASIILTRALISGPNKIERHSRTQLALQEMWAAHSPNLWIFGHYHMRFDHIAHGGRETGTRFIGLAELEYRDIQVSDI
jgi:hypothetical protein